MCFSKLFSDTFHLFRKKTADKSDTESMSFLTIDDFWVVVYEHKVPNNLPKVQYLVNCKQSSSKLKDINYSKNIFLEIIGIRRNGTYIFILFNELQQAATVSRVDRSEATLYCHQFQLKKS